VQEMQVTNKRNIINLSLHFRYKQLSINSSVKNSSKNDSSNETMVTFSKKSNFYCEILFFNMQLL